MPNVSRLVILVTFWVFTSIVVQLVWGLLAGNPPSLWEHVWVGTVLGTAVGVTEYCVQRGWIKLGIWAPSDKLKQRKRQLAQERDQIMADALARKEAQAHGE